MSIDNALLDAVIDRIVPADDDPGALALGTPNFVRAHLAASAADRDLIAAGLAALPPNFAALDPAARDAALIAVEQQPWFVRLVVLTSEGFYADPDNGGNAGARSWDMVGYRHRLPQGPSGPPVRSET